MKTPVSRFKPHWFRNQHSSYNTSPVPHLLSSNEPPSELETSVIIAAINAKISDNTPESYQFVLHHRAVLSALRRFPIELIIEILLHCVDLQGNLNLLPPVWHVGFICRKWWAATLATPALWGQLPILYLPEKNKSKQARNFKIILQRARSAPLAIHISAPYGEFLGHPTLTMLLKQSEQCKVLRLESTHHTIEHLAPSIRARLSSLELLQVDFWSGPHRLDVNTFEVAPNLRRVYLGGIYPILLKLPWKQLTHFFDTCSRSSSPTDILMSGSELVEWRHTTSDHIYFGDTVLLATFPWLTSLKLEIDNDRNLCLSILRNVTLPALETLHIRAHSCIVIEVLSYMLLRSLCKLRNLSIYSNQLSPETLTSLLDFTPHLCTLDISSIDPTDMRNLASHFNGPPLVPNLKSLQIRNCITLDTSSLATLVQARYADHKLSGKLRTPLKSIELYFRSHKARHDVHSILEGWTTETNSSEIKVFQTYRQQLLEELRYDSLQKCFRPSNKFWKSLDISFPGRIHNILTALENKQGPNPRVLYASQLHLTLRIIRNKGPDFIYGDSRYKFFERIGDILEGWDKIFINDLHNRQWATRGEDCLFFIPAHHEIRLSHQILNIAYGIEDG